MILPDKSGGRSAAIWTGGTTAGQKLAQWVDPGAAVKRWTLVPPTDGCYKLRSVRHTSLFMTVATRSVAVTPATSVDASSTPAEGCRHHCSNGLANYEVEPRSGRKVRSGGHGKGQGGWRAHRDIRLR
ncbi:RICIN domain-containing protein [Streptomyces sp. NR30]|uniref:RICIN domain-containing protein n=1 Tax=Streptomyces guryensis TaxID=2886947 RepID=A0A9Q3W039_9ACTN|nr:RICIN domain-containing protein [Streptomyces guryensis]